MKPQPGNLFLRRTCNFSQCRIYRYELRIIWDATREPKMFIGLNPSTADETQDDPTLRRCIDFARRWGAGGLVMANAAAYRSTDPKAMLRFVGDKVGPENTIAYLERLASGCAGTPIAAWGKHASKFHQQSNDGLSECTWNRHQELKRFMGPLDCLRLNKDGTPEHPLYVPGDTLPIPFNYSAA